MEYLLLFFSGTMTFISPCLLPMLPLFVSFFASGGGKADQKKAVLSALAFVLAMTLVFMCMGATAGAFGGWLARYGRVIAIISGILLVFFGLFYSGLINPRFLNKTLRPAFTPRKPGMVSSFVFGLVFFVGWTPCIGPMLSYALITAANSATAGRGIILLFCYAMGLGLPFLLSSLILDTLTAAFDRLKKHYKLINAVMGCLLAALGVLMLTGRFNAFLGLF